MQRLRRPITVGLIAVAVLLSGCGSGGSGGGATLPTDVTLPTLPEDRPTLPTLPPDTEAPATDPETPPTEPAPETEAPPTPEPTEAPATEAPATEPAPTGDQEEDSDSASWWPWALAGALVLLVGGLLIARSRRRAALHAQVEDALTRAADLARQLAVLTPEAAPAMTSEDSGRLAALGADLASIASQSTDEAHEAALGSTRDQVLVLHRMVDGIALSAGPPSAAAVDQVRERAVQLHSSATQARAELFPSSSASTPTVR